MHIILVAEEQLDVVRSELNITNAAVGFSAGLTTNFIPKNSPIKYTNVQFNKGNRYSPSTGKFTADRPGFYYIEQYWVTTSYGGYQQSLFIKKNGATVCASYGDPAGYDNN